MQALFSPLIAAVLLVHAVLGCCWQHARQAIDADHTNRVSAGSCCTHRHSTGHEPSTPSQPCDCRWECHATCVYLADEASFDSQLLAADFLGCVFPLAIIQPIDLDLIGAESSLGNTPGDSLTYAQPALRLHVLNQLWLI